MKRTLKIFLMAICLVAFMAPAHADNDKPIQVKELPAKAQTILSQHFKNQKVAPPLFRCSDQWYKRDNLQTLLPLLLKN